jgi:hypothetical protein
MTSALEVMIIVERTGKNSCASAYLLLIYLGFRLRTATLLRRALLYLLLVKL